MSKQVGRTLSYGRAEWSPSSWHSKPVRQMPEYGDTADYVRTINRIGEYPPVVSPGEVEMLKAAIAEAQAGRRFILQGGDCAELFSDCTESLIINKIKILLQMSVILTYAARKPIVRIGRMAGQYFKPRSNRTETLDGREVPTFRGDGINGIDAHEREPDPSRLESAYHASTATLNYIRAMIAGGFADLHAPYSWNLHAMERTTQWEQYREVVDHIMDAVSFMESFGGIRKESLGNIDFYTSREGLHLGFEQALTRRSQSGGWYDLGTHLPWIGNRTRDPGGAHAEYFRGIGNPVGIKLGPDTQPAELNALLSLLNPENEPGKILLITRLGADRVRETLPPLIEAIGGRRAGWSCDPMHGNTVLTPDGRKTRPFDSVLKELVDTFEVHHRSGSILCGVHFELTGENVTECVGGAVPLVEEDLATNYRTYCDPRLNYDQSMEMAFLISEKLKTVESDSY